MALDSKMHAPSEVSSTGTLPKGFLARNSGVLLSTPIVNGWTTSSGTPAQPAAALMRSERPVQPYSFMVCGRSRGSAVGGGPRGRDIGARAREAMARRTPDPRVSSRGEQERRARALARERGREILTRRSDTNAARGDGRKTHHDIVACARREVRPRCGTVTCAHHGASLCGTRAKPALSRGDLQREKKTRSRLRRRAPVREKGVADASNAKQPGLAKDYRDTLKSQFDRRGRSRARIVRSFARARRPNEKRGESAFFTSRARVFSSPLGINGTTPVCHRTCPLRRSRARTCGVALRGGTPRAPFPATPWCPPPCRSAAR